MKRLTNRPHTLGVKRWRFVFGLAIWVTFVLAALLFVADKFVSPWIKEGIYRVEARELPLLIDRWMEAGKPEGEALKGFTMGRRVDLLETDQIIEIQGQVYRTKFALTNPNGILELRAFLITTNKVLIQIAKDGKAKLATEK